MKKIFAWFIRIIGLIISTLFISGIALFFALYFWAILSTFGPLNTFLGMLWGIATLISGFVILCGIVVAWDWSNKQLDKK